MALHPRSPQVVRKDGWVAWPVFQRSSDRRRVKLSVTPRVTTQTWQRDWWCSIGTDDAATATHTLWVVLPPSPTPFLFVSARHLMGKSFPNSKRYSNWPILDKDKSAKRNRVLFAPRLISRMLVKKRNDQEREILCAGLIEKKST